MRVLSITAHGCIRVLKEALALQRRGHVVHLLGNEAPFAYNRFESFTGYHDAAQLRRSVRALAPAVDVVHIHNEPDWLVPEARKATDKPIVFDVHDLESLRWQREPDAMELAAFAAADGFVHVSDDCAAAAAHYHGTAKPVAVLPCLINEEFYPPDDHAPAPAWGTAVYAGGLGRAPERQHDDAGRELVNIRSLEPVVAAFVAQGFEFRIHPSSAPDDMLYENLGAVVSQPLAFPVLLRALRSYGYGFVGSPVSAGLMEAALPNKLFEYISQGVVPIVLNAGRAARFVREHGLGIVLDGLDNLREQLEPGPLVRRRILERRRDWTMENHIGVVEDLYAQLTGASVSEPAAEVMAR